MHDMLPLLESLHLSGPRVREKNLKNLPSNLIELHVNSWLCESRLSNIFGDLPRHIARLTLKFLIEDRSELENDLPSELVYFETGSIMCNFNLFSKLPKSLKTLKMGNCDFEPDWLTLPPQLEELRLSGSFPKSAFPHLPQSLKTLKVEHIKDLTDEDEIVVLLPKNLTRFASSGIEPVGHYELQQLPASLTDFDVAVHPVHPDTLSIYGPESLKIRVKHDEYLVTDQVRLGPNLKIFPFPTKLQLLELDYIDDDICTMLPTGLQELMTVEGLITIKGASQLPKSLTYLRARFETFNDNQTMSYLRYIPNLSLTSMGDCAGGKLNENWLYSLLPSSCSPTSSNPNCMSAVTNIDVVNQHLTSLIVMFGGPMYINKSFFEALPNFVNILQLVLHHCDAISSDWLCLIPQNVTYLIIGRLTSFPTSTQLSTLPKCLKDLDLDICETAHEPCDCIAETLLSLPRSLYRFSTVRRLPNFTSRMYEYLPPNMNMAYLEGDDYVISSALGRLYGLAEGY